MRYNGKCSTEHQYIAEQMIGRPLLSTEVVHHLDGNKTNNSRENLEVMDRVEHGRLHALMFRRVG